MSVILPVVTDSMPAIEQAKFARLDDEIYELNLVGVYCGTMSILSASPHQPPTLTDTALLATREKSGSLCRQVSRVWLRAVKVYLVALEHRATPQPGPALQGHRSHPNDRLQQSRVNEAARLLL